MTSSSLTELRQAALALWKHQRQDLEREATKRAAELALDVFGDTAGDLAKAESWKGDADGDAVAIPTLDDDGKDKLEYEHTFDEQLWLRSGCPSCGRDACRITPVSSLLELGQALDRLQDGWALREGEGEVEDGGRVDAEDLPGACDQCDEANTPAQRLYQAVVDAVEESAGDGDEEEVSEASARGRG